MLKTFAQAIGSTLGKIAARVGLGKRKEKESESPKVAKQPAPKAKTRQKAIRTRQKAIRRMAANSSITRGQKPRETVPLLPHDG